MPVFVQDLGREMSQIKKVMEVGLATLHSGWVNKTQGKVKVLKHGEFSTRWPLYKCDDFPGLGSDDLGKLIYMTGCPIGVQKTT